MELAIRLLRDLFSSVPLSDWNGLSMENKILQLFIWPAPTSFCFKRKIDMNFSAEIRPDKRFGKPCIKINRYGQASRPSRFL